MLKGLVKDSAIYSISGFLAKGIGLILLPFYTRVFSPADYGVMDMVVVCVAILTNFFSIQMNQSLFRFYLDKDMEGDKKKYFSTALVYNALIFSLLACAVILFRHELSNSLFGSADFSVVISLAAVNIMVTSIYTMGISIYRLENRAKAYALVSLANMLLSTCAVIVAVLYFDMGLVGIFVAQLLMASLFTLGLMGNISKNFSVAAISFEPFLKMARFGFPLVPTVMMLMAIQYIDRIMITNMLGLDSLGLYSVAMKLASVIVLLLAGFKVAWSPYIFANYKDEKTPAVMGAAFYYICILMLMAISFLTLFSFEIYHVLTSPAFHEAYQMTACLMLAMFFFSMGTEFSVGMAIANRNEILTVIYFFAILVNVGLNFLLIPLMGINGAAVATMLSFFFASIVSIIWSNKFYKVPYRIKHLAIYAATFAGVYLAYRLFVQNSYTVTDYALKAILLMAWLVPVYLLERKDMMALYARWRGEWFARLHN